MMMELNRKLFKTSKELLRAAAVPYAGDATDFADADTAPSALQTIRLSRNCMEILGRAGAMT